MKPIVPVSAGGEREITIGQTSNQTHWVGCNERKRKEEKRNVQRRKNKEEEVERNREKRDK